jgi:FAD/FMN-containing dehydrogenase
MMQHAGGAVRRGGPDGGDDPMAFPHREWEWSVVIIALWTDPGADSRSAAESWADDAFDSLRGVGVGCYAVDIDRFRRPGNAAETETALAFGEENAARLRELKRRVDPSNLFAAAAPL